MSPSPSDLGVGRPCQSNARSPSAKKNDRRTLRASSLLRAPILRIGLFELAGGALLTQAVVTSAKLRSRQTGALTVASRLHGVVQNFRTAPSFEAPITEFIGKLLAKPECLPSPDGPICEV